MRQAARTLTACGKAAQPTEPRLSRTRRPPDLEVADWQSALRRQFGREQQFDLENLGAHPVFSDFRVHNPTSGARYRVAIRGRAPGQNFCSCPDFATNHLGTCKHIEFTLARVEARRGGKTALGRGFESAYSEVWLDYTSERHVRFRAGTSCPPALLAQVESMFDAGAGWSLPRDRFGRLERLLHAARDSGHELCCHDDVWQFVAQFRDGERRRAALAEAYPRGFKDKALAKLLKVKLYPYQAEGALFAARAGRVLIGDEMGLGKTIQAVAAAVLFARHFGVQRVLVVCPTSIKHQWKNEFARFTERGAQVIHGLRAQRQLQYREDVFCKITHYETLARDADLIDAWAPELVIADEAQRIKNWNTIAARALKRMACNSTWLLDHETDHGHKVDELMTLLDELLEDAAAKAVIFSQWLGTHELIVRRLAQRDWGHVLFSGSVPGEKRGALVERFHADPRCRLFLSTDAGGVGLNLQHAAAVVVNMDLPWNPAILEQRIGRVHRMGQSRGVQVVNFVGQGSIEEGMLSVLAFKKSLFAGVLDGGESEVFLNGTRLSQFMKSVEQVAGAMGEADADLEAESPTVPGAVGPPSAAVDLAQAQDEDSLAAGSVATAEPEMVAEPLVENPDPLALPADPWAAILEAGAALLKGLATARAAGGATPGLAPVTFERDPVTGQASVRLRLPDAAVMQRLAKALEPWLR